MRWWVMRLWLLIAFEEPSRPKTPPSPDAKSTERPRAPSLAIATLTSWMYSSPVCCSSSLPYDTEWTRGTVESYQSYIGSKGG